MWTNWLLMHLGKMYTYALSSLFYVPLFIKVSFLQSSRILQQFWSNKKELSCMVYNYVRKRRQFGRSVDFMSDQWQTWELQFSQSTLNRFLFSCMPALGLDSAGCTLSEIPFSHDDLTPENIKCFTRFVILIKQVRIRVFFFFDSSNYIRWTICRFFVGKGRWLESFQQ